MSDGGGQDAGQVRLTDRIGVGVLTRLVTRDLVDEVLLETGRVQRRTRLLPARVVVYYVLALCLFFGDAYEEVMRKLVGSLQFMSMWQGQWNIPSTSALSQARARLGEAPLRLLFERLARPLAAPGTAGCWYQQWRVVAVDGVVLDVPDTAANVEAFGRSGNHLADSPFPQVRLVGLVECGTHAVVAAAVGGIGRYERELATELLDDLDPTMLMLADRGFYSYELWKAARGSGAQLVWRIKTDIDLPVYQRLPDGSYLSAVLPKSMRSDLRRGKSRRVERYEMPVRVIDYQLPGRSAEPLRLLTSIIDHELAPAIELAALYHRRWEIELIFDEIETHQVSGYRLLRSKSPELVKQEIWALLLTHYAVRHLMAEAAEHTDDDPERLSFIRSLRVVRRQVTDQAAFSPQQTT